MQSICILYIYYDGSIPDFSKWINNEEEKTIEINVIVTLKIHMRWKN